jgi:hypothetical protein
MVLAIFKKILLHPSSGKKNIKEGKDFYEVAPSATIFLLA